MIGAVAVSMIGSSCFALTMKSAPEMGLFKKKKKKVEQPVSDYKKLVGSDSVNVKGVMNVVVKVVVNYILVAIPSLNIIGAAIGTIVCYVTITVLDLIAMRRTVTTHPAVARNLIRPAAAAAIMGAATFFAEAVLRRVTSSNTIICLGALVIAVIVYAIFVLVLQCITYEDCLLLPKGEKIAKILHIKHKT